MEKPDNCRKSEIVTQDSTAHAPLDGGLFYDLSLLSSGALDRWWDPMSHVEFMFAFRYIIIHI